MTGSIHRSLAPALAMLLSYAPGPAGARLLHLAQDQLLCANPPTVCVRGSLTYESNDRLFSLEGRVQAATVPGLLVVTLKGLNRLGHPRFSPMEIPLDGTASEIVSFRMRPDAPDVSNWEIWTIEYRPGKDDSTGRGRPP
jgi:hypothetical protein